MERQREREREVLLNDITLDGYLVASAFRKGAMI
jgi:hypothetical protein